MAEQQKDKITGQEQQKDKTTGQQTESFKAESKVNNHYQHKMVQHLEKQDKVEVYLPKQQGESSYETVIVNDVKFIINRGERISLPKQIADILYAKLEAEGKLKQISEHQMNNMKNFISGKAIKL